MTPFLLAFQFLTIFPIRISRAIGEKDLANSMRYYPLVGAAIGLCGAGLFKVTGRLFSLNVAAVSAVVGLILFSGALHLDGFADMCDGFYGHRDRRQILNIMKDSRSGAMAVVGIICLLSMKIALLANLDTDRITSALVLLAVLGRWSMVWNAASSTYARAEGGKASSYIGRVNRQTFWIATLFSVGITLLLFRMQGLWIMAVTAGCTWAFRRYTERRIGGMTGDTLGACSELIEVLVLALISIHPPVIGL